MRADASTPRNAATDLTASGRPFTGPTRKTKTTGTR